MTNMKKITKTDIVRGVIERWKHQYPINKKLFDGTTSDEKLNALLSETELTESSVNRILGEGKGWTENKCDSCEHDVNETVLIAGIKLCSDCLTNAKSLL